MSTISELRDRVKSMRPKSNGPDQSSLLGLINDVLESVEAGDIGGGGFPNIPISTEFDTGKTFNGAAVYGYYFAPASIGSFSSSLVAAGAADLVNVSTWTVGTSPSEIAEAHVSIITGGDIILHNRTGSALTIGTYVEYTKL